MLAVAGTCTSDNVDDETLPSVNEAIQQHAQEWAEVLTRDDRMSLSLVLHETVEAQAGNADTIVSVGFMITVPMQIVSNMK